MADARKTFDFIMELEGGGVVHRVVGDPGGTTKWGFAQRKNPDVDVASLTEEHAFELFCEKYWRRHGLNRLDGQLMADQIGQMAFNTGGPPAVIAAQRAVNRVYASFGSGEKIRVDGGLGPVTAGALNAIAGHGDGLLSLWSDRFALEQIRHYSKLHPELTRKFLRGWVSRALAHDGK